MESIREKIKNLWQVVGGTPLLEVSYRYANEPERQLYVKCERSNMTGSIKDRMALYILQKAYQGGVIEPGDRIVEATSGNTGIAFAAIGRALGHKVQIIMPEWMSRERIELIKSYGAEIRLVSKEEGGFLGSIKLAELQAHKDRVFLPKQFENKYNAEAHEQTTGPEIDRQLIRQGIKPAAFVAGVGTGGTVMGVGRYLKLLYPSLKVHPLEPSESPTLSTGYKVGSHRIQGISDEFIPQIVALDKLDAIIGVNDGDAILLAQQLGKELGLAVGISSGANLLGAIKVQRELGANAPVITVFPDSNKKYISTDLFRAEPVKPDYLSPFVKLTGYRVLGKH